MISIVNRVQLRYDHNKFNKNPKYICLNFMCKTNKTLLFFLIILFSNVLFAEPVEDKLTKLSFITHWIPQAQFAGYYVAKEKGFYKREGIDLTIIPGGPERSSAEFLKERKAEFASLWLTTALRMRDQNINVVNIAQIVQRSALMLVAKKSSGINSVQDINGKKVGLWGDDFQIQPKAFFKKYNLKTEKIVPLTTSINLFLRDAVPVISVMWYNEYHTIINSGVNSDELTPFFFYDYGLNIPEDGIYIMVDFLKKRPDLVQAFVKATIEGWLYAFSNHEETLDIILKIMRKYHVSTNRVHQSWMLKRMEDLIMPNSPRGRIGVLAQEDYESTGIILKEDGFINKVPAFKSFYKNCIDYDKK